MNSRGFTLLELVIATAVLGIVLSVSSFAIAKLQWPRELDAEADWERAKARAIQSGHRVSLRRTADTSQRLFLPDGRVIGSNVDPLTGTPHGQK